MFACRQKHLGTWGQAGLLVEALPKNVLITSSTDAGALVMNKRLLEEQASRQHLLTAERLLANTDPNSYNEVVVLANNGGEKVRLAGFFYKVTKKGDPMDEDLAEKMKLHAQRLHLPIVAISEPNLYGQNQVVEERSLFSINLNGNRYMLEGFSDDFMYHDQRQLGKFIPPEEMEQVLFFLQNNKIDSKQIEQLRTKYIEADKKRQEPKIKYEQEKIFSIEKKIGYGEDEKKMEIRESGYTSWVYTVAESRKIRKIMADPSAYTRTDTIQRLNPQEVEDIVQETLRNASDEEKTKIRVWYEAFKENHAKHYGTDWGGQPKFNDESKLHNTGGS